MVQEFRGVPYDERLKLLEWCTLEERQLQGDMTQVFKLINGFYIAARTHFFISNLLVLDVTH